VLAAQTVPIPLWARIAAAAALTIWGARRNARWTVPVAACIALPTLWVIGLSMLAGAVPMLRLDRLAEDVRHLGRALLPSLAWMGRRQNAQRPAP
jgi:hypothetical protein